MNIITEIRSIWHNLRTATPIAGRGIAIEHTPSGTRISLRDPSPGDGAYPWRGMFEIVPSPSTPEDMGNLAVSVINGADPLSPLAGIAHVNRQPFGVAAARIVITGRTFIYLTFTAPVEATDEHPALPAQVAVASSTGALSSDDTTTHHLIGQAWYDDGDMLRIEQDHLPGNVYMEWYGPCLGLLEE